MCQPRIRSRYMCGVPWCVPANTTLAELLKRKQVKWNYVYRIYIEKMKKTRKFYN